MAGGLCSVTDFHTWQVDRKLTLLYGHPHEQTEAVRHSDQACQSMIYCDSDILDCRHGRCSLHHGPLCESIMQQIITKATISLDPEQQASEIERRRMILMAAQSVVETGQDKRARLRRILSYMTRLESSHTIAITASIYRLQGFPKNEAQLKAGREKYTELDDPKWHVSLAQYFDAPGYRYGGGAYQFYSAIEKSDIGIGDIVEYEVDRFIAATKQNSTVIALPTQFRGKYQKCQAFVYCTAQPMQCSHRRCALHHRQPCDEPSA